MIKQLELFKIIGISVRTTNENGQAGKDISFLWDKFFEENISSKVPNKLSDEIYSVYTHYEKDHTKPYTTILGYKVKETESVPEGLVATKCLLQKVKWQRVLYLKNGKTSGT